MIIAVFWELFSAVTEHVPRWREMPIKIGAQVLSLQFTMG